MSFDRFRVQSAIERELGCNDLEQWGSYLARFKSYRLTQTKSDDLLSELKMDASDIYFKAIFSLADAIHGISNGRHSWSVVKIYYSLFYFMRCSIATQGYAFLKNNGIYTLKLNADQLPVRRDVGSYNGERVGGDHKTTIATYSKMFEHSDVLQTNMVNEKPVYHWLMELRNQVNYRERSFSEPVNGYFYRNLFDDTKMKEQIEEYMNDSLSVYCFDADHCSLAAPLKLAMTVRDQLYRFIDFEPLDVNRKQAIDDLLIGTRLDQSAVFKDLYDFGRSA